MPEREGTGVGSAGDPPIAPTWTLRTTRPRRAPSAAQGTKDCVGEHVQAPSPRIEQARRYLNLLAGADAAHTFQPYYDRSENAQIPPGCARIVQGRLDDVWPELVARQHKGAAIAVTMAETDGRGRKSANMIRPRAVWIEADTILRRDLPLPPTITVETSPGHYHYLYVCRDLGWEVWHGVQQTLIEEYGSDPQAGSRTQVLRVPGTLHQKDPANPHLVRIVEELTTERIYTAAEVAAAFPPRVTQPSRRRVGPRAQPPSVGALVAPRPNPVRTGSRTRFFRLSSRSRPASRRAAPSSRKATGPTIRQLWWTGRSGIGGFGPWRACIMRAEARTRALSSPVPQAAAMPRWALSAARRSSMPRTSAASGTAWRSASIQSCAVQRSRSGPSIGSLGATVAGRPAAAAGHGATAALSGNFCAGSGRGRSWAMGSFARP